jgi:thiol-disulfide isomerase/thioredoxin
MAENLGHVTYVAPEGETTEWDDIQRKMGNLPPLPPRFVPDAYAPPETTERDDPARVSSATSRRELEAMEDDFEDDRFLEEYRRRRMEELKQANAVPRFGAVLPVTRASFVVDVTDASTKHFVVVFLFRENCGRCELAEKALEELARKFPRTKFVRANARDILPGYPDASVPTVLVYRSRNVAATHVGLDPYGGERHMTPEGVRLALNESGPVCVNGDGDGDGDGDGVGGDDVHGDDIARRLYAERIVRGMIADGRRAREAREDSG